MRYGHHRVLVTEYLTDSQSIQLSLGDDQHPTVRPDSLLTPQPDLAAVPQGDEGLAPLVVDEA